MCSCAGVCVCAFDECKKSGIEMNLMRLMSVWKPWHKFDQFKTKFGTSHIFHTVHRNCLFKSMSNKFFVFAIAKPRPYSSMVIGSATKCQSEIQNITRKKIPFHITNWDTNWIQPVIQRLYDTFFGVHLIPEL